MNKAQWEWGRICLISAILLQPTYASAEDIKPPLCAAEGASTTACQVYLVKAESLFDTPDAYKAKQIRIIGWARLMVGADGIYLERDAANLGRALLIKIDIDKAAAQRVTSRDSGLRDFYIEGTFNPSEIQSKVDAVGVISNIVRFEFWPSRS
jgi:hypothetical protein